jgi:intraflagellar transport protein 74
LLRTKIGDIAAEIQRMRSELDRAAKDSVVTAQLERRYDVLLREVRSLEGDLADFNLAMDKSRSAVVDAGEIVVVFQAVRHRNEALARELDAIFVERQERERGAARLEEQVQELQRQSEARINSLPGQQVQAYRAMTQESRSLGAEAQQLQSELEQLNAQIEHAEADLRRDRVRDEFAATEKRAAMLWREKAQLEEELGATRLDPAEARDKLLAKVKEDNARLQQLDRQLKEAEAAAAGRRRAVAEVTAESEERRGEAGDNAKYEMLFRRDLEMTEFIDRFPEVKDKEVLEQRRVQNTVTALLEHISEGFERAKSMPNKESASEMREDLDDKQRELRASEMTAERLQDELHLRQTELEKINTLDKKIALELRALQERTAQMREEMAKFADVAGLRAAADHARAVLHDKAQRYRAEREALRPQVAAAAADYERRRAALAKEPQAQVLEALEAKLRNYEQSVFSLREFISTKGRETDFEPIRDEAMRLLQELNALIQREVGLLK